MDKTWVIEQPDQRLVRHLCRKLGCHPVTATVLVNRKMDSEKKAAGFLKPSLADIKSLFSLKDLNTAVLRIADAIDKKERILIFGDYDVDGITSTTIMFEFLKHAGANVRYHIPHRINEGYGLKPEHIADVAAPMEIDLIVTVDCGSSSGKAVACARQAGIDVIVTDHHDIADIPPAHAVVNPKRCDCTSGLKHLAGVGVAFALLLGLRKQLREKGFFTGIAEPNLKEICDLVALGTIADIVPLVYENRIITQIGMETINSGLRPGIAALVEACGIKKPALEAEDLAFRLGPRLNAAGRMDHAHLAVDLLTTRDAEKARDLAARINGLNTRRQNVEAGILRRIEMYLEQSPQILDQKALVLADPEWHQGVLGIVASRLADKYCRPVILFTSSNGMWVGSARSTPGIDLYGHLSACADNLEAFGGHAMAAGLSARPEQMKDFSRSFNSRISKYCQDSLFVSSVRIDCELGFDMITETLANELLGLEPFGEQNPEPVFAANNVEVVFSKVMGGKHLRLMLRQPDSLKKHTLPAVWFNIDAQRPVPRHLGRIAFRLRWNYYNGKKDLQLVVEEIAKTLLTQES